MAHQQYPEHDPHDDPGDEAGGQETEATLAHEDAFGHDTDADREGIGAE